MKTEAARLIEVFQDAIVDLVLKVESDKTLSATDIESANIVVGMAMLNAYNLAQVVQRGSDYYDNNSEKVDRLFREAAAFARSLQAEGFGVPDVELLN